VHDIRRLAARLRLPAVGAVVGATMVILGLLGPATVANALGRAGPQQSTSDVKAFMTLYGWADNSPPGPVIYHPCLHSTAGGTGTYADPVTFATDVSELGWCQRIYVPYMKRYFIHEDECSECDRDWSRSGLYRFDMWAGGDAASVHQPEKRALLHCESTWTRASSVTDPNDPTIIVDPPADLPVTTAPIFSPTPGCWPGPIAVTNPGKQVTASGVPVSLQIRATDSDTGQTPAFTATGLPTGLSIGSASGVISGVPATHARRKVTVTVSDASNSASVTFMWIVTRH
jgi:hypothetical protein